MLNGRQLGGVCDVEFRANSFGFRMQSGVLRPEQPIRFSLAAKEEVRLDVFDTRGQKVAALLRAVLPSGEHEAALKFNGTQGLYFLRLQAGGREVMRRVLVD